MKHASIVIFLLSFLHSGLFGQDIEFVREDLTFELQGEYFVVTGDYYFCNIGETPVRQVMFYPFPVDPAYGPVDSVIMIRKSSGKNVFRNSGSKGASFFIDIEPYEIAIYKISYRQKLMANKAEYILTTTATWNRPLELVSFELIFPDNIIIDSISYQPDSKDTAGLINHYYWAFKDFMPDKNMVIYFQNKYRIRTTFGGN